MTREAQLLLHGLNDDSRRVVLAEAQYLAGHREVDATHVEEALRSLGRSSERPTRQSPVLRRR